ncbi:MAG: cytochrome c [Terracidiphilus sp.]
MGRYLLGIVIGLVLVPIGVFCYFKYGNPPVAVNDKPLPYEKLVTGVPLHARIDREMVKTPPVQADEDTFMAGAQLYADNCAVCHGYHGQPSRIGSHEYPKAPPLWEAHHNGNVVGVSDDPPGETYWKVANGIRLSGMPSYKDLLTETQMWQVSLLLANADKPLPPAALAILKGEKAAASPATATPGAPAKK